MHSSEQRPAGPGPAAPRETPEAARERRRLELLKMKSGGGRRNGSDAQPAQADTAHARAIAERVAKLRQEYLRDHPDDREGADLFAGMAEFFDDEKRLQDRDRRDVRERLRLVQKLTEFNARWTRFVHERSGDRSFMEAYWRRLESLSRREKAESAYARSRSGILTQAATLKVFEKLGLNPHLSKPSEDAYQKIDLWVEDHTPVQIKTHGHGEETEVIETDTAAPLHFEIGSGESAARVSAAADDDILGFRLKLNSYAREIGRKSLKGLFIVIPRTQIDRVTGEPSPKLLQDIATKLRALGHEVPGVDASGAGRV